VSFAPSGTNRSPMKLAFDLDPREDGLVGVQFGRLAVDLALGDLNPVRRSGRFR